MNTAICLFRHQAGNPVRSGHVYFIGGLPTAFQIHLKAWSGSKNGPDSVWGHHPPRQFCDRTEKQAAKGVNSIVTLRTARRWTPSDKMPVVRRRTEAQLWREGSGLWKSWSGLQHNCFKVPQSVSASHQVNDALYLLLSVHWLGNHTWGHSALPRSLSPEL